MKKRKLFIAENNYFTNYLIEEINDRVKKDILEILQNHKQNISHILSNNERIDYYINSAKKCIDFDIKYFKSNFDFVADLENQLCYIKESSLISVLEWYENEDVTDFITIYGEELADTGYKIEILDVIHIDDEDDFIKKYWDLKGHKIYPQIINFIEYKTLIKLRDAIPPENRNLETIEHPRIFVENYGFKFFEALKESIVKSPLADYSFIYRMMLKDKLIYDTIGDSEFRCWLSDVYEIEIDKTKQLHRCTTDIKKTLYSTIKDTIKR
jgi:hypothetical protein